jgi:hypothetical protein
VAAFAALVAACGTSGATGAGDGGAPAASDAGAVLQVGIDEPVALASDGTMLFWLTRAGAFASSVDGQGARTVAPASPSSVRLALDASALYWRTAAAIVAAPKAGGAARDVFTDARLAGGFAVRGSSLFVALSEVARPAQVNAVPLAGGAPVALGALPDTDPPDLAAATAARVYVSASALFALAIAGGAGGVASRVGDPCVALAADDDAAYCVGRDAAVRRIGDDGATLALAQGETGATHLAVDREHAYWIAGTSVTAIRRAPKRGGAVVTVASEPSMRAVAVDDAAVYWEAGGAIKRLKK